MSTADDDGLRKATVWSIVYDIKNMAIHFKTAKSPAIKGLAMKSLDFSNRTPCRLLDIHTVSS